LFNTEKVISSISVL